jgi:hypothetical protein
MDLIMNMKNVRKIFTNNLVKHASAIVNLASDRKKESSYIGKDLFLATLVRVLSDILSFFLQVTDGSSDFQRTEDHISTLVLLYLAFLTNTWHLN